MHESALSREDGVIAVDVQKDFYLGGALPVPDANEILPVLNHWIDKAKRGYATVVLSRDWHPPNHCSFKSQGGPWPAHCIQDTPGATFHPDLVRPLEALIVDKATTPEREEYSDFDGTGLGEHLRGLGVRRLWIGGLATDYCIRATVLDALREGFEVHVLKAAVRAVDVQAGDGDRALAEMQQAGAIIEE